MGTDGYGLNKQSRCVFFDTDPVFLRTDPYNPVPIRTKRPLPVVPGIALFAGGPPAAEELGVQQQIL